MVVLIELLRINWKLRLNGDCVLRPLALGYSFHSARASSRKKAGKVNCLMCWEYVGRM